MYNKIYINSLIYSSLFISMLLNIMAFPGIMQHIKPNFLLLLVLFWIVKEPRRVGIGHAFCCGLLLDVLIGSTFGIQALTFSLMSYLLFKTFIRMATYSILQQSICIMMISFIGLIMGFWLEHAFGFAMIDYHMLISVVSNAVLWPFLCAVMSVFLRFRKTPHDFSEL